MNILCNCGKKEKRGRAKLERKKSHREITFPFALFCQRKEKAAADTNISILQSVAYPNHREVYILYYCLFSFLHTRDKTLHESLPSFLSVCNFRPSHLLSCCLFLTIRHPCEVSRNLEYVVFSHHQQICFSI